MRAPCVAPVWLDACGGIAPPPHERSRPYRPFTEATSEIGVLRGIFALRTAKLPSNVLTLSCKTPPPCRPHLGGAAAAATNAEWQEPSAADVTTACSSEPPGGGSAAGPRLGGFCQLVRGGWRGFVNLS